MDPQECTLADCPDPAYFARDFAEILRATINANPSMGDECDVVSVTMLGPYTLSVMLSGGEVFSVAVKRIDSGYKPDTPSEDN